MKSLNLIAMGQFTLDDIAPFLSWLNTVPAIERSAVKMKQKPPVGSGKLTPMLKALEQFGYVGKKQDVFTITAAGENFLRGNVFDRKALIKGFFVIEDEVKNVIALLNDSTTGRLPKHRITLSITETEMIAFFSWAQSCELFGHDRKKNEIFRLDRGTPKGPVEIQSQAEISAPLRAA